MLTALSQEVASEMAIQRIGVVGFGQMGSGIAQICAQAGLDDLAHFEQVRILAGRLAQALSSMPGVRIESPTVRTSMVILHAPPSADAP